MGFFNKKNDKIRVMFYEGDLPAFIAERPCLLSISKDKLLLSQIKPPVSVSLDINRIINIDFLSEQSFMQKYKGNSGTELREKEIAKGYTVFTFLGKDGYEHRFIVWTVMSNNIKMIKIRDKIFNNTQPMNYEI